MCWKVRQARVSFSSWLTTMLSVGHQDGKDRAGVLYRDMSLGNWIIYRGEGILIDWEFKCGDVEDARAYERTVCPPTCLLATRPLKFSL